MEIILTEINQNHPLTIAVKMVLCHLIHGRITYHSQTLSMSETKSNPPPTEVGEGLTQTELDAAATSDASDQQADLDDPTLPDGKVAKLIDSKADVATTPAYNPANLDSAALEILKKEQTEQLLAFIEQMNVLHTTSDDSKIAKKTEKKAKRKARIRSLEEQIAESFGEHVEAERCKKNCTCEDKHFTVDPNIRPNTTFADYIYHRAQNLAEQQNEDTANKANQIKNYIEEMFAKPNCSFSGLGHMEVRNITEEITMEILKIKNPKIADIVKAFKTTAEDLTTQQLSSFDPKDLLEENEDFFKKLIEIVKAKKPIKTYLDWLIRGSEDIGILNLTRIWREKYPSYDPEKKIKELENIADSAQQANLWADIFFSKSGPGLHPDIKAIDHIDTLTEAECTARGIDPNSFQRTGLRNIIKETLPDNENSFQLFLSAVVKIYLMHLAETIRTQVDQDQMRVIREHLQKILTYYTKKTIDGKTLLHLGVKLPGDIREAFQFSCLCEQVEVPDEKSSESIARKSLEKDTDFTGDMDIASIHDKIRFGVMLTQEDSASPEKIEKATQKIIAVLSAIFGTDVSQGRLRYTFESGKTNPNSTGNHQAFHITFRYRYQCRSNGKNERGTHKIKTIEVEVQISKYMDSHEKLLDHDKYKINKDAKITSMTGMKVPFTEFITDICDALLSNYRFPEGSDRVFKQGELEELVFDDQPKEKWALTLFEILSKRDAEGNLVNGRSISELYRSQHQWEKIKKIITTFKIYEAKHIRDLRAKIELRKSRGRNPRQYLDWRKEIQEIILNQKPQHAFVPTKINFAAENAEKAIQEFENMVKDESAPNSISDPDNGDDD